MMDKHTEGPNVETCVMVCPQCEGEGGYPDGLDEAACHTECTRCKGNGWIVDVNACNGIANPNAIGELVEAAGGIASELQCYIDMTHGESTKAEIQARLDSFNSLLAKVRGEDHG